jgi:pimeloyl-ACP methyl ester carboxylesterase
MKPTSPTTTHPLNQNNKTFVKTDDGVNLYFEEVGEGQPLLFVHEFAGDWRSWEPQLRFFSRYFRCITFSARGYLPSDVPTSPTDYSQDRAVKDIVCLLDHLKVEKAHIVGLSMGGFATLHMGIYHSNRALSLVIAGCGYGAEPNKSSDFKNEAEAAAALFDSVGPVEAAKKYTSGPTRVQFINKDPRGWAEFAQQMAEHDPIGSANTLRGVQKMRPSLWELVEEMKSIQIPTLILTGDEDSPCLEPSLLMKKNIPSSSLVVLPRAGHTNNLEDPDVFNRHLMDFYFSVLSGRYAMRDPRSQQSGILGFSK